METLLLNREAVGENARMEEVIVAVEEAFAAYHRGDVQMPAKSYIDLPKYDGDFRSMPAYMDAGDWDAAGVKWVNVHPDNPEKHGLPTVMGTMIYSDPETAYPLAVMDGTTLTMKRTGAAAAVATDHLAVADASTVGIVGAGTQAYTQLEAVAQVRDDVNLRPLSSRLHVSGSYKFGFETELFLTALWDYIDLNPVSLSLSLEIRRFRDVVRSESPELSDQFPRRERFVQVDRANLFEVAFGMRRSVPLRLGRRLVAKISE